MGFSGAPKIQWLYENPELEGDRDDDLVLQNVPDEYSNEIKEYLELLFEGSAGGSGVYDEKFVRAVAEVLALMDRKREEQGKRPCIRDLRLVLVCEIYRCSNRNRSKMRKDGLRSTFYAHLVDSLRREIVLNGITEPAALIAQVNHDVVEDNRDKDEIEFIRNEAAMRAERMIYMLEDDEDVPVDCSWTVLKRVVRRPVRQSVHRKSPGKPSAKSLSKKPKAKTPDVVESIRIVFKDDMRGRESVNLVEDIVPDLRDVAEDFVRKRREASVTGAVEQEEERQVNHLIAGLMDFGRYQRFLEVLSEGDLNGILRDVQRSVKGVTKAKMKTSQQTAEAALAHQLRTSVESPYIATVKAADRTSNTASIEGIQDQDVRDRIMRDTIDSHVPTTRVFGLRRAEAVLVNDCVRHFNPVLLEEFTRFAGERWEIAMNDKLRAFIMGKLSEGGNAGLDAMIARDHIADVKFVARDLSYYLKRVTDKPLENVTLADLRIGELDPMVEVIVSTRQSNAYIDTAVNAVVSGERLADPGPDVSINDVVDAARVFRDKIVLTAVKSFLDQAVNKAKMSGVRIRLLAEAILGSVSAEEMIWYDDAPKEQLIAIVDAAFEFKQQFVESLGCGEDNRIVEYVQKLSRYAAMGRVRSFVARRLVSGFSGASLRAEIPSAYSGDVYLGMKLRIQGHATGLPIRIRVNDSCHEARADRGVLAEGTETPEELKIMIRSALDSILTAGDGETGSKLSLYDALREELFSSTIIVRTKGGELLELPRGATGLDMAYKLHGDILAAMVGIIEIDDPLAELPIEREIPRYQPLSHGKTYVIKTVPTGEKVPICPEDCLFVKGSAVNGVKRNLRKRSIDVNIEDGRRYLEELSRVLNCSIDDYVRMIGDVIGLEGDLSDDDSRNNVFEAVGNASVNPVMILSDVFEMKAFAWQTSLRQRLDGLPADIVNGERELLEIAVEKGVGFWEIEIELPDQVGADERLKQILRVNGLNVYEHRAHDKNKPIEGHDTVRYMLDLSQRSVSIYTLFKSLVRVSKMYPVKVVADFEESFELQAKIDTVKRFGGVGGSDVLRHVLDTFLRIPEHAEDVQSVTVKVVRGGKGEEGEEGEGG